jgi:hypothetical protein
MKTRNTSTLLLALVAGVLALSATRAEAIIIHVRPVGFAFGQTIRLNFANIGERSGIIINYRIVDADGVVLAQSERPLTVPFGGIVSVDLNRDSLPRPDLRIQIRAEFEVANGDLDDLRGSLEVFDNDTGKSTIFMIDTTDAGPQHH